MAKLYRLLYKVGYRNSPMWKYGRFDVKKLVSVLLVVMLLGIALMGCTATDPLVDDIYTQDVLPSEDSTYDVGSIVLEYKNGYFTNLYLKGVPVSSGNGNGISYSLFDATTFLYAINDDDPQPKTPAEVMAILSGQAGGTFDWNGQNLTGLGTLSAFTLGGTMDVNSQALINVLDLDLGTESTAGTFWATLTAANAGTAWLIKSRDTSDIHRARLGLSGGVDTAVWAWVNSTHTGIVLSGGIDVGGTTWTNTGGAWTIPAVTLNGAISDGVDEGTAGEVLTSNGTDNVPTWQAAGGGATKEFFVPVNRADDMNQTVALPGAYINAAGKRAWIAFHIPHDFNSITEAVVILNPLTTATHRFDIISDYAAVGEAYNTHSGSDLNHDFSMTALQFYEIDVSGILSSLSADDYGGIKLLGDATNTPDALVVGFRLKYT